MCNTYRDLTDRKSWVMIQLLLLLLTRPSFGMLLQETQRCKFVLAFNPHTPGCPPQKNFTLDPWLQRQVATLHGPDAFRIVITGPAIFVVDAVPVGCMYTANFTLPKAGAYRVEVIWVYRSYHAFWELPGTVEPMRNVRLNTTVHCNTDTYLPKCQNISQFFLASPMLTLPGMWIRHNTSLVWQPPGCRLPAFSPARLLHCMQPQNKKRILVIGDSHLHGFILELQRSLHHETNTITQHKHGHFYVQVGNATFNSVWDPQLELFQASIGHGWRGVDIDPFVDNIVILSVGAHFVETCGTCRGQGYTPVPLWQVLYRLHHIAKRVCEVLAQRTMVIWFTLPTSQPLNQRYRNPWRYQFIAHEIVPKLTACGVKVVDYFNPTNTFVDETSDHLHYNGWIQTALLQMFQHIVCNK
eukprot:TRINITY_DN2657_c0_g1_i1.p1 TRINITY_DN2657_c0_g1~~TRINITY_DN2657_c0_g1_i1.p1  ORF type:complete len:412 (+),score=16.52 TRINITY_DN2657_c0_g1_i1:121-1356(+)